MLMNFFDVSSVIEVRWLSVALGYCPVGLVVWQRKVFDQFAVLQARLLVKK